MLSQSKIVSSNPFCYNMIRISTGLGGTRLASSPEWLIRRPWLAMAARRWSAVLVRSAWYVPGCRGRVENISGVARVRDSESSRPATHSTKLINNR